jgi:hypothetical protein
MGTELVPETSEKLHIPTRLSAWENFIDFCHRKSFKTYVIITVCLCKFTYCHILMHCGCCQILMSCNSCNSTSNSRWNRSVLTIGYHFSDSWWSLCRGSRSSSCSCRSVVCVRFVFSSVAVALIMTLMLGFSTVNFLCMSGDKGGCVHRHACSCVCMHSCSSVVSDIYITW